MAKGYCSLEILDIVDSINKHSFISSGSYVGYTDGINPIDITINYYTPDSYSYSDFYSIARGKSFSGAYSGSILQDPYLYLDYNNGFNIDFNDNWVDYAYSGDINRYFKNLSNFDSSLFNRATGDSYLSFTISPTTNSAQTGLVKFETLLGSSGNYIKNDYIANQQSWASYRLYSGGVNADKNPPTGFWGLVSWAIEMTNDIYISGNIISGSGNGKYPIIYSSGSDIRESYLQYCINTEGIECDETEIKDKNICYTGSLTGSGLSLFLQNIRSQFKNSIFTDYDSIPSSLEYVDSSNIERIFGFWSGRLEYNDFKSGDRIYFDLYPFNYTEEYSKIFYSGPPIPTTGFYLEHSKDFFNIDGLVSGLNKKLYSGTSGFISYPVWYNYDCIFGSGNTGIYVTGNLMFSEKINDNVINFTSLRNLKSGYSLYIKYVDRKIFDATNTKGLKYLMPSILELQASSNNQSWVTIDRKENINWTGITPTKILSTGILNDINLIDENYYQDEDDTFIDITEILGSGEFLELDSFIQSGYKRLGPKCPPQIFERSVSVVYPSGFPNNSISCKGIEEDQKESGEQPKTGVESDSKVPPIYEHNFLRTGWNITGTNGSNISEFPYYNYPHYRVVLSGFNTNNNNFLIPTNNFYVKNINLFYSTSGIMPPHTGADQCVIGSMYMLDVQGIVPVTITGNLSIEISKQHSGKRIFNNIRVSAPISGLSSGDYVKFNKESGRLVTGCGTGFLNDTIYATGCFNTGVSDWFYDTGTYLISFEKEFTGCFPSGSGSISGEYIRLKSAFVNEQLAYGGFFNETFNVSITTGVQFTGMAIAEIVAQNLTGYYNYTGTITGYANSGYYQLISGVNINLTYPIQSDYIAGGITGYNNASAWLNYGSPMEFDWLSINNKTISYSSDSGSYVAPDFYSNSGVLLDTINSNPSVFLCSASVQQGKILLNSLLSGYNGNSIGLTFGKGENIGINYPNFETVSLTGGQDLYKKIYATGSYTGILNKVLYSSGYYTSNNATGNISGPINVYQGTRDFTGVWNLTTGDFFSGYVNFAQNNLINYDTYSNTIGGPDFGQFPKTIDFILSYNNILNTESTDLVKLTISGLNTNSGIVRFISGVNS